ncbi:MAG: 4Fe-4S binding protein [Elusimicrobiota bacterium]|nr:4Fe-4S binding protein [Elusimicrobiota bacterium]
MRVIKKVKGNPEEGINIFDSPPGTACPAVETIKDADVTILVTDPTPFGMYDFKLAVDMCALLGVTPLVIANRLYPGATEPEEYCLKNNLKIIGRIQDEKEIAVRYSKGKLIAAGSEKYNNIFKEIAQNILDEAPKIVRNPPRSFKAPELKNEKKGLLPDSVNSSCSPRQIVVISGKGGTGKTSIAAALSFYSRGEAAIADCDVDAADMHLILKPDIQESGHFIGGEKMEINTDRCIACGRCEDVCKFDAVSHKTESEYKIDELACEGCGACVEVCPVDAIRSKEVISGSWFVSATRFGPMAHAKLSPAGENSGKLVTFIKKKALSLAEQVNAGRIISDGSPGIGCPVIASLTGVDYVLIVTEPTVSGIHDLERVLDLVKHFSLKAGVVVNKSDLNPQQTSGIFKLTEKYGQDILGEIPYDSNITEAQIKGLALPEYAPDSQAAKKISELWRKINQNEIAPA